MGRAHRTSSSLTCLCSFTQLVKNPLQCRRPLLDSWVKKFPWRRNRLPTPVFLGFPGGSDSKESACSARDLGSIPGLGRSPGRRHGNPLQCSCLENSCGKRSLASYSPWSHKESDMAEATDHACTVFMASLPRGTSEVVVAHLIVGCHTRVWFLTRPHLCPSYTS